MAGLPEPLPDGRGVPLATGAPDGIGASSRALRTAGRIEVDPAVTREVGLHPGVGVVGADRAAATGRIGLAGEEPFDEPGRDAELAQEHGHRRRVVLAEAGLVHHEALDDRGVDARSVAEVRVVLELRRVEEGVADLDRQVVRVVRSARSGGSRRAGRSTAVRASRRAASPSRTARRSRAGSSARPRGGAPPSSRRPSRLRRRAS